ncbi:MAG: hypothetical protein EXR59_00100 [Dehalococcoidia bacterium]|nr:hypothetical protein [Dehalococcoidia bacterium]
MIRLWNDDSPFSTEMVLANVAFSLSFCSPYPMALPASSMHAPGYRGGLLATSAIPALLSGFTALSGISLILITSRNDYLRQYSHERI